MSLEKAVKLCDYYTSVTPCKMKWMWGEGLFGFALTELQEYLGEDRYKSFLEGYVGYYRQNPPKVHSSDTTAPGLITFYMAEKYGNKAAEKLTEDVLYYMKNEPRVLESLVNHMGHSGYDKWYPKSVWVDSLMMFGVFAGIYGKRKNDDFFLKTSREQPVLLSKYIFDTKTSLWYHCYWVKPKTHFPIARTFWGRGNAWVIESLPRILDNTGESRESGQIKELLLKTSEALLKRQNIDGSFSTLLGKPGIYKEASATALIASGWLHAVRKGYLPEKFREAALKAYEWADSCLTEKDGKVLFGKISGPTIPTHIFPWLGYAFVQRKPNYPYGMAAYVWASVEVDRLNKQNR